MALRVTAQDCLGMSALSYSRYPLRPGPAQTDWLSITSPKMPSPQHLCCSSPCPQLLSFTHLVVAVHPLLPASCQSWRLLLRSCRRGRTGSTLLYILLGSGLLQYDPQHHPSSLLVATITCVIDLTGELTSTLLLPSCLVDVASCCCWLFYKVSSDLLGASVSTRSSTMTFMLRTVQHKSVLLLRSRGESWSEEMQSHLSEKDPSLRSEDRGKGAGAGHPSWFPATLSLGCKRSVERVFCDTMPESLISDFC